MNILKKIAAAILPLVVLASCNHSEEPDKIFNSFVTFVGNNDLNAVFSTQEKEDSPEVNFTVNHTIPELNPGTRYLISYSTPSGNPFVSGPITLYQVMGVQNGTVTEAAMEEISKMMSADTDATPGRTGVYLHCPVTSSFKPKTFGLYVDATTVDNAVPDVYLCFEGDPNMVTQRGTFLGSFSIKPLFEKPGCDAINFHYYHQGEMKTVKYNNPNKHFTPQN